MTHQAEDQKRDFLLALLATSEWQLKLARVARAAFEPRADLDRAVEFWTERVEAIERLLQRHDDTVAEAQRAVEILDAAVRAAGHCPECGLDLDTFEQCPDCQHVDCDCH